MEKIELPTRSSLESGLDNGEDETEAFIAHQPIRDGRKTKIRHVIVVACLCLGFVVAGILTLLKFHRAPDVDDSGAEWIECGSTPQEAKANNCHFDPMMRAWIPHTCFFEEPLSEYDPYHDRPWYMDQNGTQRADIPTIREIIRGGVPETVYARDYHTDHCLYTWRKMSIAISKKKPYVDSRSFSAWHSRHCADQISNTLRDVWNNPEVDQLPLRMSASTLDYFSCIRLPWPEAEA
ncbi:hypothetical protein NA57DRAFT_56680 [Rhizodiscina lignyota]|uniref:Uncharacterized protein n=1 Tax=Rhizodiscina lignyota TaxID=1504668 RepID=A0A9P4ICJ6_9PEZI|nr:hypothetical protein NA57DRAFT_56680 [Rhizodiscina lignyota]